MTKTSPAKRQDSDGRLCAVRRVDSTKRMCRIGPRDIQILTALERCPLTPDQLQRLSVMFVMPFRDTHNLRRRLRRMAQAGYVSGWPYAVATDGRSPRYFKLARDGYRILHGIDAPLPKRRRFEAISPAHHHHTFCLAEVTVHLLISAFQNGCAIEHFAPENSVRLQADPFTLIPDCSFVIRRPDGRTFPFVVELDNSTERVRSKLDVESIERKLRGYDAHQSAYDKSDPDRYLVLFVATRSQQRMQHILDLAAMVMQQPRRTVFVGTDLKSWLDCDPFRDAVLQDHRGLKRTLVPWGSAKSRQYIQQKPVAVLT
jgi:hypothetical protein